MRRGRTWSTVLLVFSLGALAFYGLGGLLVLSIGGGRFTWAGWALLLVALLALPGAWLSLNRLLNRGNPPELPASLVHAAAVAWPFLVALGSLVSRRSGAGWLMPVLTFLCALIPLAWGFELARRNMAAFGPLRAWSALSLGVFLSTPLALLIEGALVFIGIIIWAVVLMQDPANVEKLNEISRMFREGSVDASVVREIVLPLLSTPFVIGMGVAFIVGLGPAIEELLKSLAALALLALKPTPAEGFLGGALAGAGFGLIETLFNLSNPGVQWTALIFARLGANLMHATVSAIVGWGLVVAWRERRFGRAALAYLAAWVLHGLWNVLGLTPMLSLFYQGDWVFYVETLSKVLLVGLCVGCVAIWWAAIRHLRPAALPLVEISAEL